MMRPALVCVLYVIVSDCATLAFADVRGEVITKWGERRAQVARVKFMVNATVTALAGSHGPSENDPNRWLPDQDITYREQRVLLLDLAKGQFRRELHGQIWNHSREAYQPFVKHEIFDGSQLGVFIPHDQNTSSGFVPSLTQPEVILQPEHGSIVRFLGSGDLPLFCSLGLFIPYHARSSAKSIADLNGSDKQGIWAERSIDGLRHAMLSFENSAGRRRSSEEWRIRPDLQGAVVALRTFSNNSPRLALFVEYNDRRPFPMPQKWTTTRFNNDGMPIENTLFVLESMDLDPALRDDSFTISLQPDQVIIKNRRLQKVDSSGMSTRPISARDFSAPRPWGVWNYFVFTIAFVLATTGAVLLFKAFRRQE